MNKYLQSLLFVSINLSVCLSISAQSSRVETDIKNQKIEIIPSSVVRNEQNIPEIKATEVLNPSLFFMICLSSSYLSFFDTDLLLKK